MQGSLRERSRGSWELRVFVGVDPVIKRHRYRSKTVRANRAEAERELEDMVASVRSCRVSVCVRRCRNCSTPGTRSPR